jgi:hypothetical protein
MSINRPSWPHSAVEILQQVNRLLVDRLNADPTASAAGLWSVETGQLNLSKPGGHRIIWSIQGGPIARGWQTQGPDMPAKCVAIRMPTLQAEIRYKAAGNVGITTNDIQGAEEVIRALCIVWNQLRPADYDAQEPSESWDAFTGDPGQREIVARFSMPLQCLVLQDPYLFKTIDSITAQGVPITS